ncbi:unnamed protein product [Linum tenue]|uniref:F-box domain-containing protein n=1 Tax=Linum tenue TaxID=586396 RepID=A0AAV0HWT4_9ROSI|nr:unnamed protein product [Linum tenue]
MIMETTADHHTRRSFTTSSPSSAVGFTLLPSELIEKILLSLALPELVRVKSLNRSVSRIASDPAFLREFNALSSSATWLFLYKKRSWHRDAVLQGFTSGSSSWFRVEIRDPIRPGGGESLYFLTAAGNFFLFASNSRKEVISVDLAARTARTIPPSPLGPRGTSSWRRSGMKLVVSRSDRNQFRFMFGELVDSRPVLFLYSSETNTWRSVEAREARGGEWSDHIFLNVSNGPEENLVMAVRLSDGLDPQPVVVRPRFNAAEGGGQQPPSAVGFSWGNVTIDRVHVYGDGYTMVVRSKGGDGGVRVLESMELWGLDGDNRKWRYLSGVPVKIMEVIRKPYKAMVGCVEGRREIGRINGVLMCNFEGLWDVVWVEYDVGRKDWSLVPVPDCKMMGLNLAGIAVSSGLTMSESP